MGPGLVQTSMVLLVTSLLTLGLFALGGAAVLREGRCEPAARGLESGS